jgi:hypothetical protein
MRLSSPDLARAVMDYRWLLDRGYASRAALKLVGDRRQLTRDERMILFRGVSSSGVSAARAALIASSAEGRALLVDGYNQALTVMHYLRGRPLFLGTDGLLRDAGGSQGHIADPELFASSARALVECIVHQGPSSVAVYLDSPVGGSAGHAGLFRGLFAERGLTVEVGLERSADFPLKAAPRASLVATSDGGIADALIKEGAVSGGGPQIFDAARWTIEGSFGGRSLLDLRILLDPRRGGSEGNEAL